MFGVYVGTFICCYGVSWLMSVFTRSAVLSATAGIGITIAVAFLTLSLFYSDPRMKFRDQQSLCLCALVVAIVGLACWYAGTFIYRRRVAP